MSVQYNFSSNPILLDHLLLHPPPYQAKMLFTDGSYFAHDRRRVFRASRLEQDRILVCTATLLVAAILGYEHISISHATLPEAVIRHTALFHSPSSFLAGCFASSPSSLSSCWIHCFADTVSNGAATLRSQHKRSDHLAVRSLLRI